MMNFLSLYRCNANEDMTLIMNLIAMGSAILTMALAIAQGGISLT